jgi:hypothetical protein
MDPRVFALAAVGPSPSNRTVSRTGALSKTEQRRNWSTGYCEGALGGATLMILVLSVGVLVFGVAALMLARACGSTRSVGQLLYDTEHPEADDR